MQDRPNLYIVGAAKSGTTALASLLAGSPDIFVPDVKEPHFHVAKQLKGKIPFLVESQSHYFDLYHNQAADKARYWLDASVLYMPYYREFCSSLKNHGLERVKIIIILRDPLQRALSAYKHSMRYDAAETDSFKEAVMKDDGRRSGNPMLCYQWLSDYYEPVKAIREQFKDVLVIRSIDLENNTQKVIDNIADFLSINSFTSRELKEKEANSVGFVWRKRSQGQFINRLFSARYRYILRNRFPSLYNKIRHLVVRCFTTTNSPEIVVDQEIEELFKKKRVLIEDYLGYRIH